MPENKKYIAFINKFKPYLLGVIRGIGVFTALYLILSFIMYKTNFESPFLYFLMFLFIILGGFICGVYVYKKVRGRGFLTGILSTIPYSIFIFLLISIINNFTLTSDILIVFMLSLAGGFLGGVTAANTKI